MIGDAGKSSYVPVGYSMGRMAVDNKNLYQHQKESK